MRNLPRMNDVLNWMDDNKLDSRRTTVQLSDNGVRIAVLTRGQWMRLFFCDDCGVYSNDFEYLRLSVIPGKALNGVERVGNWKEVAE